jgi:hypothetical protein
MVTGCVAVPVYESGYYPSYYGPYPYAYVGPELNVFVTGFHVRRFVHEAHFIHNGRGFHNGGGFRGGSGFRGVRH